MSRVNFFLDYLDKIFRGPFFRSRIFTIILILENVLDCGNNFPIHIRLEHIFVFSLITTKRLISAQMYICVKKTLKNVVVILVLTATYS